MLHEVSSGAWGKATEITADAKETEYLNDLLHDLLAEDTGQTAAYWKHRYKEQSNTDLYITAKLSKRLGLVDHVGVPRTVETSTYNLLRVPKSRKTRT
jgi:ATP-dependent protease ClpP protease subunit